METELLQAELEVTATEALIAKKFMEAHPDESALAFERSGISGAAPLLQSVEPAVAAKVVMRMAPFNASQYIAAIDEPIAGAIIEQLPVDVAATILRRVDPAVRKRLLSHLPRDDAKSLKRVLHYPEGTAGALMDPEGLALPYDITCEEALSRVREAESRVLYYVYVLERNDKLVGVVNLRKLLSARPSADILSVATPKVSRIGAHDGKETILAHSGWRTFHALPVVDRNEIFVGVLRYETVRWLEQEFRSDSFKSGRHSPFLAMGELSWKGVSHAALGLFSSLANSASNDSTKSSK